MRKSLAVLLVSLFMLTGCISSTIKAQLSSNAAKLDGYVKQMDDNNTTSEEDQDLVRAMRVWTWEMNKGANGETPPDDVRLALEDLIRTKGE